MSPYSWPFAPDEGNAPRSRAGRPEARLAADWLSPPPIFQPAGREEGLPGAPNGQSPPVTRARPPSRRRVLFSEPNDFGAR